MKRVDWIRRWQWPREPIGSTETVVSASLSGMSLRNIVFCTFRHLHNYVMSLGYLGLLFGCRHVRRTRNQASFR